MVSLAIWNRVMGISTIVIAILVVSSSSSQLHVLFLLISSIKFLNLVEKCEN